jgi:antitoxin component YwqK of YwqJK toxin-antitoxin module
MRWAPCVLCAVLAAGCSESITSRVDPHTGVLEIVEWRDGRRHGRTQAYDHNDVLREEAHFERGVLSGMRTYWHPNGDKQRELSYAGGLRHGPERGWHAGGMLAFDGTWVDGDRSGTWIWYAEDGQRVREEDWERGTKLAERLLAGADPASADPAGDPGGDDPGGD